MIYAATHPNVAIKYHASGMFSHVDSDASYLSVRKARSRVEGRNYLSSASADSTGAPVHSPPTKWTLTRRMFNHEKCYGIGG